MGILGWTLVYKEKLVDCTCLGTSLVNNFEVEFLKNIGRE